MADFNHLKDSIETLGKEFLNFSDEERNNDNSAWRICRNKLSKELWEYAELLKVLKYSDIDEEIFEDSISDAIIECLEGKPDSWISLFGYVLKQKLFNTKTDESKKGISEVSKDVIKLGRDLAKWAELKGLTTNIYKRNSYVEAKLFEYGHSWGKSDEQIKKALDWLDKKNVIEGNQTVESDDSNSEVFDFLSEKDLFGFEENQEILLKKLSLYIKAANKVYLRKKGKNQKNDVFYSRWFTNILLAALLNENLSGLDIEQFLAPYDLIDKTELENFTKDNNWKPNTDRKSIGLMCGINESSIGNTYDRFENLINEEYRQKLDKAGL